MHCTRWAIIILVAVSLASCTDAGPDEPTVVYDGTVATYSGPLTIGEGVTPIAYRNDSVKPTVISLTRWIPGCWTIEEARAYLAEHPPTVEHECFAGMVNTEHVPPGSDARLVSYLDPGVVMVTVYWGRGESERGLPAAFLDITPG